MDEAEERFSLKWSDFQTNLTEGFNNLLQESLMVDVTLAADGKFVQAHKLVLSVCSPYFKNLFKVNPCKHPIVILKDVGHNELSDMLQYMYRGEVGVRHNELPAFLKLADTLKIKGLTGEKIGEIDHEFLKTSNLTKERVHKKRSRIMRAECDKENAKFMSAGTKPSNKLCGRKKRRQSAEGQKKSTKRKKCNVDSECVRMNENISDSGNKCKGDSDSDDKSCNISLPALKVDQIKGDHKTLPDVSSCAVKSSIDETTSESENDKNLEDNSTHNFDGYSEESHGEEDEFEMSMSQYDPNTLMETDQTPQGHISSLIISRAPRAFVWDYFLKETHQAICLNCGKTFKGQRPNTICEQHLKRMHPEFYKILLEKKIKRAELHMNPMVMGLGIPSYDHD